MIQLTMLIAGLTFATGLLAQAPKGAPGTAALQGTWVITSMNGQGIPGEAPELTLTFTGDKYHQTLGGEVNERGTITIDASKKPMTIDLNITEGNDAGKLQLGVFEVTGDTMRMSLDAPGGGKRPADFTVSEGAIVVVAKKKG